MLEAKNLHKVYNNGQKFLEVLKGVNLKIDKAEFISILGPSGAGKSTLLNLLGGLDLPTQGEVYIEGINLYNLSEEARARIRNRKIGFVFQLYHLLPEFSAVENVYLPAAIKGFSNRDQSKGRASELLDILGLKERLNHKPNQLSGGEQQRVAIARALMNEPDILLCDEPTGNLDSRMGEDIVNLLFSLNREKKQTMIVVTHEKEIAERADHIINLKDGQIVGEGLKRVNPSFKLKEGEKNGA
ncbi:MAG: ABC transporter ATP-binding protein [Candidatus Omnitrophica bacterium]|nr:ABC transporter ATP-binding protein [Candidatus Omnitrophota bacterium]